MVEIGSMIVPIFFSIASKFEPYEFVNRFVDLLETVEKNEEEI